MIELRWPYDGQVLNPRQGTAGPDGLTIEVRGSVRGSATVELAGTTLETSVGEFSLPVTLQPGRTDLLARACGPFGRGEHAVRVWYAPDEVKRYRFSVDDNSFWLRELGRHEQRYPSLFDLPYLANWRRLHERYGLKVVLNIYWATEDGFTLADFPARFRPEFESSSDWLKLAWHAATNKPDRPYEYAGYQEIADDHDRVVEQIHRFAGEATCSPPTVVHWAEVTADGMRALVEREVRNLSGIFRRLRGRHAGVYHLRDERAAIVEACARYIDEETQIAFSALGMVANNTPLEAIEPGLEAIAARPENGGILDYFTHEQYFWEFYERYIPDHWDRVEAMVRWAAERDYQPCWFHEGYLGGPEIR